MAIINAAGYVRVSTPGQVEDGESLSTQRQQIIQYARNHSYELTEIYADEGISGGSLKDRHALQKCLLDGHEGKFTVLIIVRLSRFGRNALELLNNYRELKNAGIELRSISEGIDFSNTYGQFMLTMLAAIAALERDIIKETTLENRIARGKRGIPTSGAMPYARSYNKDTGEWSLDEDKARILRKVADDYLAGGNLEKLATFVPMSYNNLIKVLTLRCGDKWTVNFKGKAPITYIIPKILSDDVIQKIKDRLRFNRKNNRTDIPNKYLLTGFLRCDACKNTLNGQTFHSANKDYRYYVHRTRSTVCKALSHVNALQIEDAIMRTIFENFVDIPMFEKAIAESIPDINYIDELKLEIQSAEKELNKIQRELDKLVNAVLKGTLSKKTIQNKEAELLDAKQRLIAELNRNIQHLNSLPDINTVKQDADKIRRILLEKYGGNEHLEEMLFEEKRALLHLLFDGQDKNGTPYGIYITVRDLGKRQGRGNGRIQAIDYLIYGSMMHGLRTLFGDDINYMGFVDEKIKEEERGNNNIKPFNAGRQL